MFYHLFLAQLQNPKLNLSSLILTQNLQASHFRVKVKEIRKDFGTLLDLGSHYFFSGSLAYSLQMLVDMLLSCGDTRYGPASRTLHANLFYLECSF